MRAKGTFQTKAEGHQVQNNGDKNVGWGDAGPPKGYIESICVANNGQFDFAIVFAKFCIRFRSCEGRRPGTNRVGVPLQGLALGYEHRRSATAGNAVQR